MSLLKLPRSRSSLKWSLARSGAGRAKAGAGAARALLSPAQPSPSPWPRPRPAPAGALVPPLSAQAPGARGPRVKERGAGRARRSARELPPAPYDPCSRISSRLRPCVPPRRMQVPLCAPAPGDAAFPHAVELRAGPPSCPRPPGLGTARHRLRSRDGLTLPAAMCQPAFTSALWPAATRGEQRSQVGVRQSGERKQETPIRLRNVSVSMCACVCMWVHRAHLPISRFRNAPRVGATNAVLGARPF